MTHLLLTLALTMAAVSTQSSVKRLLSALNESDLSFPADHEWSSYFNGSNSSEDETFATTEISNDNDTFHDFHPRKKRLGRHSSNIYSPTNSRRNLLGDGERRGGRLGRGAGAAIGNNIATTLPTGLGLIGTALDDNRLGLGQGITVDDTLDLDNTLDLADILGIDTSLDLNDILGLDDRLERIATARRLQRQAAARRKRLERRRRRRFITPSAPMVVVEFDANDDRDLEDLENECEELDCEDACCIDGFGPWCCSTDELIDELDLSNVGSIPVTFGDLDDLVSVGNDDSTDEGMRCKRHSDCEPGFVCRRSLDCDLAALLSGEECDRFCEIQDF